MRAWLLTVCHPQGGLGIRATRTLLHRLSALAGATAFGSEFSLRVQVAWTVQADCPVAYEELFSSPHVDVVHSLSNCKRWIPGLKTMIEFCRCEPLHIASLACALNRHASLATLTSGMAW